MKVTQGEIHLQSVFAETKLELNFWTLDLVFILIRARNL